jgi:hypothetical protein
MDVDRAAPPPIYPAYSSVNAKQTPLNQRRFWLCLLYLVEKQSLKQNAPEAPFLI